MRNKERENTKGNSGMRKAKVWEGRVTAVDRVSEARMDNTRHCGRETNSRNILLRGKLSSDLQSVAILKPASVKRYQNEKAAIAMPHFSHQPTLWVLNQKPLQLPSQVPMD